MDEEQERKYFLIGLVVGIVVTVLFWIGMADQVEISKVKNGYLTLKNKTYTVTLYDSLDAPEKNNK